jgi:hypothetical protein
MVGLPFQINITLLIASIHYIAKFKFPVEYIFNILLLLVEFKFITITLQNS